MCSGRNMFRPAGRHMCRPRRSRMRDLLQAHVRQRRPRAGINVHTLRCAPARGRSRPDSGRDSPRVAADARAGSKMSAQEVVAPAATRAGAPTRARLAPPKAGAGGGGGPKPHRAPSLPRTPVGPPAYPCALSHPRRWVSPTQPARGVATRGANRDAPCVVYRLAGAPVIRFRASAEQSRDLGEPLLAGE